MKERSGDVEEERQMFRRVVVECAEEVYGMRRVGGRGRERNGGVRKKVR